MSNSSKEELVQIAEWYLDNGIDEVIEEEPVNCFEQYKQKQLSKAPIVRATPQAMPEPITAQKTQTVSSSEPIIIKEEPTQQKPQQSSSEDLFKGHGSMSLQDALNKLEIKNKTLNIQTQVSNIMTPQEAIELSTKLAQQAQTIEELEQFVRDFDGCQLKKSATNTVFSDGCREADILVMGEAPGNHEDLEGIPFCGQSGQLFDEILKSIGLTRQKNLYITNTIFWRPPGNRRPTQEELDICKPFVEKHIALFKPKLIITAGATAMSLIFKEKISITKQHGMPVAYANDYMNSEECKAIPLYHPAFLMRQPSKKKEVWKDMLFIENMLKEHRIL